MIYITGDTHGNFDRVKYFTNRFETSKSDIMVILGDVGVNYSGGVRDMSKKELLQGLPLTFFCIHGNHEIRPNILPSYIKKMWNGGIVYYEERYPNILFAKDGEVFNLDGQSCLVIGGAYSVDKFYRLQKKFGWWEDEQPTYEIKLDVASKITELNNIVDVVLSHTCPYKYLPREVFLSCVDQSTIDSSTEEWLDTIEDKLDYKKWYCGHYHTEKKIDKLHFLFESVYEFKI